LTSTAGTGLNQGWTYDANGNRLTQTGSQPSAYTISSVNNRITSISGFITRTYGYDNAGNTTGDATTTFTYNDAGRMVSATKAGVTTTYSLNALGQRVRKSTSGLSTDFVYDEAGHLLGEYDGAGNLLQETVWLADTPSVVLKPNGGSGVSAFYIHTDHLNTPRRISRPSNNVVVWRWDADAFGTSPANEDPDGDTQLLGFNLRFPGQYLDSETGLHYNWFRYFDPHSARYTQNDPIGLLGGINTYAYVGGNPLVKIDPAALQQAMSLPGVPGLPLYIPPAFVPGTPEYSDLVDSGDRALRDFMDGLADSRPSTWPSDVPHPSDAPPEYTCTRRYHRHCALLLLIPSGAAKSCLEEIRLDASDYRRLCLVQDACSRRLRNIRYV
jgi:RHS repeat-associated protein